MIINDSILEDNLDDFDGISNFVDDLFRLQ